MKIEKQTGEQISRYELLKTLGEGGMAEVWQARDRLTGRIVAIKFLPNQGPHLQERLRLEYKKLAELSHPNIISAFEFVQEPSNSFLVMPYVEQGSLKDFMTQHPGPMPPHQALAVIEPILSALDYVHSHGFTHSDVKPSSILLGSDFVPFLTFVYPLSQAATTPVWTPGVMYYISPEQSVKDRSLSFGSDIYSAGVLLYEMLTGQVPPRGEAPRPLLKANPQVSPRLEAVVLKSLEKNPANRFRSAEEMRQALLQLSSSSAEPAEETPHLPSWKELSRRTWIAFANAAMLTFGSMFATAVLLIVISAARKYLF
jgi:serine/threonine-protein kinase